MEMPMSNKDQRDTTDNANDAADEKRAADRRTGEDGSEAIAPNPPRTTTGGSFTAPKFGSAASGGLELEPGPERD
jgi:hypothetical protein